jgi:hypothetical protein
MLLQQLLLPLLLTIHVDYVGLLAAAARCLR